MLKTFLICFVAIQVIASERVLQTEPLDIVGNLQKESSERKSAEEKNNSLVNKKIEDLRLENEKKIGNKLQNLFYGKEKVVKKDAPSNSKQPIDRKSIRLAPYFGKTFILNGEDQVDSNFLGGLRLDAFLTDRFILGVALEYDYAKLTEYKIGNYSHWNGDKIGHSYQKNDLKYRRMGFEIDGRYVFTNTRNVNPYIGLGLGVHRNGLSYAQDELQGHEFSSNYKNYYGSDKYTALNFTALVRMGVDVPLGDLYGMSLDFKYVKGMGEDFSSRDGKRFKGRSQRQLKDLGKDLNDSSRTSLTGGMYLFF